MSPYTYPGVKYHPKFQYEWSSSGLELLGKIEKDIEKHGGRKLVANAIEAETVKMVLKKARFPHRAFEWTDYEIQVLLKYYHKFKPKTIAKRLKKSTNAITWKARQYGFYIRECEGKSFIKLSE